MKNGSLVDRFVAAQFVEEFPELFADVLGVEPEQFWVGEVLASQR
jgi:hypothetical protein